MVRPRSCSHLICPVLFMATLVVFLNYFIFPCQDGTMFRCNQNSINTEETESGSNDKSVIEDNVTNRLVYADEDVPIIWVGGVPRSGTTLVRAILDAHPNIRCGEETRVIPSMMRKHKEMRYWQIERARLDEAKVTEQIMEHALRAYILSVIVEHGEPAPRLCNKDPLTLNEIELSLRLFPKSKFILMIRDGRAVVHSIISRRVGVGGFDLSSYNASLTEWNRLVHNMYKSCLEHSDVCFPLMYEHLVLDPEPQIRKLFEFIGEPWNDIVLHHEQMIGKEGGVSLSRREKSTDQVIRPVNKDALYAWVKEFPSDVRENAGKVAPMLKLLGYNPENVVVNYGDKSLEEINEESKNLDPSSAERDSDLKTISKDNKL